MSRKVNVKQNRPVLGLRGNSIAELLLKQESIARTASQSSTHSHSKPVQTTLSGWTGTKDDLRTTAHELEAARLVVQQKEVEQEQRLAAFKQAAIAYRNEVEIVAKNDANVVHELGLLVQGESPKKASFGPPEKVVPRPGSPDATARIRWSKGPGARSYEVATAPDASGPWTHAAVVSGTRVTLTGLPSGKKLWVRVASVGKSGTSDWSNPVAVNVA